MKGWEIDARTEGKEVGIAGPFRTRKAAREALPVVAADDFPGYRAVAAGKECMWLGDGKRANAIVLVITECEFQP